MTEHQPEQITATVSVSAVVKALHLNDTNGVDDRVIAVPQRDGAEASIRRAFQGTERYSNPSAAPVHIRPESLVEEAAARTPYGGKRPPGTYHARDWVRDEHNLSEHLEEWDDKWHDKVEEAHEIHMETWETNIRGMIVGEHELGVHKGVDITLVGEEDDDR